MTAGGVFDGHNDLLWELRLRSGYDFDRIDLATDCSAHGLHTDLVRLNAGGVGAQFWSVYVPAGWGRDVPGDGEAGSAVLRATLEQIDAAHRMIGRYPDRLALARTATEVRRAWRQGRIASLLGAEGGHQIAGSLAVLRALYRLGVRAMTLTHNESLPWADSATDVPISGGLAPFGREVVAEMNRLGMLVDLSHVSRTVMDDALAATTRPVVFTHSSARALCDHPRNVPDDVLVSLAGNGGVCMVTFVPYFVNEQVRQWEEAVHADARAAGLDPFDLVGYQPFLAARTRRDPPPPATIKDVADHLEHVREVAGPGHVGLGGDYDGVGWLPEGLEDVSGYPRLLERLAERGWSQADLSALTHGNMLRVLEEAGIGRTAAEEE